MLLTSISTAYGEENNQADAVVRGFLEAVNIIDLPEGKQMLLKYTWGIGEIKYPEIISYKKLYGGTFDADAEGVKGYKQLLHMKLSSKGGTELNKRYIVLCYKDKTSGTWKVFEFRESGDDAEYEALAAKKDLNDTQYSKAQYNYRRYGYWLMRAGKPSEARKAFKQAFDINTKDPDAKPIEFQKYVNITDRILE